MRILLTTLLLTLNSLKQSNLSVKILTTYLLPLTTHLLLCAYKSFLYIMFIQVITFMYKFCKCINFIAVE